MFIDSFQVEVQNPATGKWTVNRRFRARYKWQNISRRILGILKRTRPEITGSPLIQSLIVKSDAHLHARKVALEKRPCSVRITRTEREGARLVKLIIWQNGEWRE